MKHSKNHLLSSQDKKRIFAQICAIKNELSYQRTPHRLGTPNRQPPVVASCAGGGLRGEVLESFLVPALTPSGEITRYWCPGHYLEGEAACALIAEMCMLGC